MSQIALTDVMLDYPAPGGSRHEGVRALDGLSLQVEDGQFVSLVGPSGCGKSTVLKLVAGLLQPTEGAVAIDGQVVDGVPPSIGFMFQNDALLPWSTALENVALALELRGVPRPERVQRARTLTDLVGLRGFEDAYPSTLSGGMRKRVALARVLAYDPAVYLMDEPFGALDAQTKVQMGAELLRLWSGLQKTVLFVTHDIEEAIALSDRVLVMSRRPGRIVSDYAIDLPRPRDFYDIRFTNEFRELHRAIWRDLAAEVGPTSGVVAVG
ncbi:MAG: ABC transporter ATP-binding protein [Chloroflexi bacterium]|nr:ABC transporter ATP-binding protein [Chloroflexota bacterium]